MYYSQNVIPDPIYRCPTRNCSFLRLDTCQRRKARAKDPKARAIGTIFDSVDNFEDCADCAGPLDIFGQQVRVSAKAGERRVYPTRERKQYKKTDRKNAPNGTYANFRALDPDAPWTGTTCGHTKTRSEFNYPNRCKVCSQPYEDAKNAKRKAQRKAERERKRAEKAGLVKPRPTCHCGRQVRARGLCSRCYQHQRDVEIKRSHHKRVPNG